MERAQGEDIINQLNYTALNAGLTGLRLSIKKFVSDIQNHSSNYDTKHS